MPGSLSFSCLTSRSKTSERLENFLLINLTKSRLISSLITVSVPVWEGGFGIGRRFGKELFNLSDKSVTRSNTGNRNQERLEIRKCFCYNRGS